MTILASSVGTVLCLGDSNQRDSTTRDSTMWGSGPA